ncbi:MAG: N-acetyltransferase [Thermoanaerobaculia bacterium]|nr:N-acetyltransferase [Thermoanaerobaculia bacterium]
MEIDVEKLQVVNNEKESRFEIDVNGKLAMAEYRLKPGQITFTHTEVPKELGGKGIAQKLVRAALDHAKAKNLKVVPLCQFVSSFIQRNGEYESLVAK